MEVTIALALSILGSVISVSSFAISRKDKAVQNAKEANMGLINYRLDELDGKVQKILDKLDTFDTEVDNRIEKAINRHIEVYHKKG